MQWGTVFRCAVAVSALIGSTACTATTNNAQPPPTTTVTSTQPTTTATTAPPTTEPTTTQPPPPTQFVPADIHFAAGCNISLPPAASYYALSCDGLASVQHVVWSVWNQTEADGTGMYAVGSCQPTCVDGKLIPYPVSIHFDSPIRTKCGMAWGNYSFTFLTKPPTDGKPVVVLTVVPTDVRACE
jgi:hypothetical protein